MKKRPSSTLARLMQQLAEILEPFSAVQTILIAAMCFSAFLCPNPSAAQTQGSGSIQGTITDPSGAVIPNATVVATNPATGQSVSARTSGAGYYVLPSLPPATYNVTAKADGFQTLLHKDVSVNAFATVNLDIHLNLGVESQTVTVNSLPPQLDTANGTMEVAIPHDTYSSLPVAMSGGPKSPLGFVQLAPGVTTGVNNTFVLNGGAGGSSALYMNGMPTTNVNIGGDQRTITIDTPLEAVENSQVLSSGIPAYYLGAGVVNLVLKSGTNKFHGNVYENVRNTAFDAAGYFSASTPVEHQNEFGGTIGGPILKNRLFFFFNYDAYRYTAGVNPEYYSLPTTGERTGDFSALSVPIYDPATTTCNGSKCTATAFPGNVIPAGRISSISKLLEADLPGTINSSLQNNFLNAFNNGLDQDTYVGKLDFAVTNTNHLTFMALNGSRHNTGLPSTGPMLPLPYANSRYAEMYSDIYQIQDTQTITANLLNVFGYQFNRLDIPQINATTSGNWASKAGLSGIPSGQASSNFPPITFSGPNSPTNWAAANFTQSFDNNVTSNVFQDNMVWVHGNHNLTIGGQMELNANANSTPSQLGNIAFSNHETAGFTSAGALNVSGGNAYASFLLGQVNSATLTDTTVPTVQERFRDYALYAQDDWKATRKLNINLGIRYEIPTPFMEANNKISFLNPTMPNPAVDNFPGALQFAGSGPDSCGCRTPVKTHYLGLEPRVGFAYSPRNNTVIRGSFSIIHFISGALGGDGNPGQLGYAASPTFASPNNGITAGFVWDSGFPAYTHAPFFDPTLNTGYNTTAGATGGSVTYTDPERAGREPYSEYWNLTLQQQLTPATVISINYAASASHLLSINGGVGRYSNQLNPKYLALGSLLTATESPTTLAQAQAIMPGIELPYANFKGSIAQMLRPFPQYSGIAFSNADYGDGHYNSMQVLLEHSMSRGLYLHAAYTWGREIDDAGGESARVSGAVANRNAYNLAMQRAVSTDPPQVFAVVANYMLPFGQGHFLSSHNTLVNTVIGGWQLSANGHYNTAPYFGIFAATCNLPNAGSCYADYNPSFTGPVRINGSYGAGQSIGGPKVSPVPYIDVKAFANPAAYTYGTTPRVGAYGIRNVASENEDFALDKTFQMKEAIALKLRADAFNAFNRTELGAIGTNISSTAFGKVTKQVNSPRQLQFEAYLSF